MKLYVGNLSFQTTETELHDLFEQHGSVREASLIMDKMTNRSRGFGFVTMSNATEGQAAIDSLNGKPLDGRNLMINEARPREDRPHSGGGGHSNRSFSHSRR